MLCYLNMTHFKTVQICRLLIIFFITFYYFYVMNLNIEPTADGSATLYRPDIDEHYHSVKGALAESNYVYIELGWRHTGNNLKPIRVFEVGFGTGLNAALTAYKARKGETETEYFAIELYPLSSDVTDALLPMQEPEYKEDFIAVNKAEWDTPDKINPYFSLHKIKGDLLTMEVPQNLNVVYFDAFAPEKQPEMWEESVFSKIFNAMSEGGVLTTYCAKGAIRRLLQNIGFTVERLPGPPGGKREVLRATKATSTKIS